MSIKTVLIASTIASVVALASLSVFADKDKDTDSYSSETNNESHKKGGYHGHKKRHGGFKRVFAKLDLSDVQKTQIKNLRQQKRDGNLTREGFRSELAGILTAEQNTKLMEIKAKRSERKQRRSMRREQMKRLGLSVEQKAQVKQARKELHEVFRSQRKAAMSAKMKTILTAEQYSKFETFDKR